MEGVLLLRTRTCPGSFFLFLVCGALFWGLYYIGIYQVGRGGVSLRDYGQEKVSHLPPSAIIIFCCCETGPAKKEEKGLQCCPSHFSLVIYLFIIFWGYIFLNIITAGGMCTGYFPLFILIKNCVIWSSIQSSESPLHKCRSIEIRLIFYIGKIQKKILKKEISSKIYNNIRTTKEYYKRFQKNIFFILLYLWLERAGPTPPLWCFR